MVTVIDGVVDDKGNEIYSDKPITNSKKLINKISKFEIHCRCKSTGLYSNDKFFRK